MGKLFMMYDSRVQGNLVMIDVPPQPHVSYMQGLVTLVTSMHCFFLLLSRIR